MQKLNHKEVGEGEPLIILHGLFGMLDNWKSFAKEIGSQYKVYLVDQRNHGRSFHDEDMDYGLMADDLSQFMDKQDLESAYIMGHSMGGKTAMTFAGEYPGKVKKLIVVDIGPKKYEAGHETIFNAMRSLPIDEIESRKEARQHLGEYITEEGIRLFLLKNLSRKKEGGYRWKMNLEGIYQNYDKILASIPDDIHYEGPALFINGQSSNYITKEDRPMIKKHFPNAQLQTIKNAGHWVHVDQQEELLGSVSAFLSEN